MTRRATRITQFKRQPGQLWAVMFNEPIDLAEETRTRDWCEANCDGWFDIGHRIVRFDREDDAKLCYLRFA